ncbi:carbon-nitrogen hydrolase family protein [Fictibacillus sp. WQ 8-8]|uniref:carbon-nitrogen hydrolase family protein n=1 Tax=Fictibacillus sp. WQ 8-8 TaxID=2938788 RepID=UPI00210A3571|nr:carbon-nitrogen hydrolase family protein [Fictibacillus sp. WQ 8-8]MCQ6267815.1 carbon-nitrogen hydrolase family protein [Fictibacillus sp. WQ 8-8]
MEQPIQIAVVQASFRNGDVSYNVNRMRKMIEQIKADHPQMRFIVFPELSATGYYLSADIKEVAEEQNGTIFRQFRKTASENNLYVAYGYVERGIAGEIYNSVQLIDPSGNALANYRKIHLTPLEKEFFSSGSEAVAVQTDIGKIGLMICWDLAFPELARALALQGAELLIAPAAWERPYDGSFLKFGMARAIDNTVYVAAPNHIGQSENLSFFGKSVIYSPDGTAMVSAEGDEEGTLVAELDYKKRNEIKKSFFTMLEERRTDIY